MYPNKIFHHDRLSTSKKEKGARLSYKIRRNLA